MSLEFAPPATLWPRFPASDKRLGCDLLDGFGPAALFIEQNNVAFNAEGARGLCSSRGTNRIPSQNEGVIRIVKSL
jgi:hypothetical protein